MSKLEWIFVLLTLYLVSPTVLAEVFDVTDPNRAVDLSNGNPSLRLKSPGKSPYASAKTWPLTKGIPPGFKVRKITEKAFRSH